MREVGNPACQISTFGGFLHSLSSEVRTVDHALQTGGKGARGRPAAGSATGGSDLHGRQVALPDEGDILDRRGGAEITRELRRKTVPARVKGHVRTGSEVKDAVWPDDI